tara:strand:+ start:6482 stop:8842 length:2361 start_codon:yes stop_codon:yes gene_type:complete
MKKANIIFLLLFAVLFFSYSYSQNSTLINHNSPFENSLQNKNTASNPTVTITGSLIKSTSSPFTATFTFSENIQNFSLSDVVVSNASTSIFNKINESKYTALITPISDGIVTVDVPANSLQDLANNDNLASNTFSIIYDTTKPTVVITSDTPNPTNAASFVTTFTFSENIDDFDETYFSLTNANYSNFVYINDALFKVTITPIADGTVSITIPENEIEDNAGNGIVAAQFSTNVDRTKPTTTITSTVSNQTNAAFTTAITFSEDVTGFDINDITLGNATASNFITTNAKKYSALITPTSDGFVTVDVASNVANDAASNGNSAAAQFNTTYDITKPTVVITANKTNPTNATNFVVTFTFSEEISSFDEQSFSVTNGNTNNFTTISNSVYSVTITPLADGTVTINLPENSVKDNAENGNVTIQFSIDVDTTSPSTTITSSVTNRTNSTFTATITFSEDVSGFDINDITLNNADATNFTATNAKIYSALITPKVDGIVTIDVASNVANDVASNENSAANQFSITFDGTKPVAPSVLSIDNYTCTNITTTTADNTLVFNGTAEVNSQVEVYVNSVSIGNTTTKTNGTWSFDYTSVTLADATYLITAKATDSFNNLSEFSSAFTIIISTLDTDGDLNPDFCDDDDDNDGVLDSVDNSYLPNPGQEDTDGDGIADVEEDCDNDGIINYFDKDVASCQNGIIMKDKYGFSPNGDGINETWVIEDIALYPNNMVRIYNRSGKVVYQMKGYNNTFNGLSNTINSSKKLPVGAYYFTIEFNTPNSKPAKGWIYINY